MLRVHPRLTLIEAYRLAEHLGLSLLCLDGRVYMGRAEERRLAA